MSREIKGLIGFILAVIVGLVLTFSVANAIEEEFKQLDHSIKSASTSVSFGQDLGYGNNQVINYVKLYLEPVEGLGEDFKVQLWSDSIIDIWSENVPIGEIGQKALYTFNFPEDITLIDSEELGFAIDTTGNKNFYIYGSNATSSWEYGEAWNGELGSVVDLYFDFDFVEPPTPIFESMSYLVASALSFTGEIFTDLSPVVVVILALRYALISVLPKLIDLLLR